MTEYESKILKKAVNSLQKPLENGSEVRVIAVPGIHFVRYYFALVYYKNFKIVHVSYNLDFLDYLNPNIVVLLFTSANQKPILHYMSNDVFRITDHDFAEEYFEILEAAEETLPFTCKKALKICNENCETQLMTLSIEERCWICNCTKNKISII